MKKTIYLYKSGVLKQKDYSLALITKTETIPIPIQQIDLIICFSEITINKRVLQLLNKHKITILFFSYRGNYIGKFVPKEYMDGKALIDQVNAYQDENIRLYIAQTMTYANIHNCNSVLKYYQKKGRILDHEISEIETILNQIKSTTEITKLLLLEAHAKQYYYQCFDKILENKDFTFDKRSMNPPENEINAMMSYGYALLYSHYLSVLSRSSLLPQISFIHSLSKSSDALQYDLADITKPVIIDRMIFRMIRKGQLEKDMFTYKKDGTCYMNTKGISVFVNEFDKQLQKTIKINDTSYSYKRLISKEVHALSNYIRQNTRNYNPYLSKY